MPEQRNPNRAGTRSPRGGGFRPGPGGPERRKIEHGPCPDALDTLKSRFDAIPAPYNFVPLASWVHCPENGNQISLDLPFRDGLCGEIPFTLVADTPLLVGAEQDKPDPRDNRPGKVRFAQAPDGTYLIPGSSLRGMLRSVIEIASFGRMRQVDDTRYGLRDITRADNPYARRVNHEVRAGFVRRGPGGQRELVPCRFARLSHADLERWWNQRMPVFRGGTGVKKKYDIWRDLCARQGIRDPLQFPCRIESDRVSAIPGPTLGYPVLTGQINDRERDHNAKQHDFVFYDRDEAGLIPVTDEDWRSFLQIHGDQIRDHGTAGNAMRPSWPDHWRDCFNRGEEIPVFWLDGKLDRTGRRRVRLGLARMPKIGWDWSIHDLIRNTSEAHLDGPEQGHDYDLADRLFGTLSDKQDRTLKGRVSVGTAVVSGDQPTPERHGPTILNGPKPTYYPNYIRQQTRADGSLASRDYATCIETQDNTKPEIRGFKRYPARPEAVVQPLTAEQAQGSQAVANILYPLPSGTRFTGRIQFHNLLPMELGALVWALTWGNRDHLRHGLGMGKPFGFGQVRFEIHWPDTKCVRNVALDAGKSEIDPKNLCTSFVDHMSGAYDAGPLPGAWQDSPQIQGLLAMADPNRAGDFPADLRHMRLQRCVDPSRGRPAPYSEFVWAKQKHLALHEYAAEARATPAGQRPSPPPASGSARPSASPARSAIGHPWLREKIEEIRTANHAQVDEVIGGKLLATAWQEIEDPEEKAAVLSEIRSMWEQKGWWDDPPGRGKRKVKSIYEPE